MSNHEIIAGIEKLVRAVPAVKANSHVNSAEFSKWQKEVQRVLGDKAASILDPIRRTAPPRGNMFPSTAPEERFRAAMDTAREMLGSILAEVHEENSRNRPGAPSASPTSQIVESTKIVFVVHGRNVHLRDSLFAFLRAVDLKPLEWSQAITATGEGSPYIGQVLDAAFSKARAVVVLMTPDDEAWLKKEFLDGYDEQYEREPTGQARPNVLFEAGMAMGRDSKRTVLVQIGYLRPFSDVGGRHVLRLDN